MAESARNQKNTQVVAHAMLMGLMNKLGTPRLLRNFSKKFSEYGNVGNKVTIEQPIEVEVNSGRRVQYSDIVFTNTEIQIDEHRHFGIATNHIDETFWNVGVSGMMKPGVVIPRGLQVLADTINSNVNDNLTRHTANVVHPGAAGAIPSSHGDFSTAHVYFEDMGVPAAGRNVLLSPERVKSVSDSIKSDNLFDQTLIHDTIVSCYQGRISNMLIFEQQGVAQHTVGLYNGGVYSGGAESTPRIKGANQGGKELLTDGWTANSVLNKGDVITIHNGTANYVRKLNPLSRRPTTHRATFLVDETCTANSAGVMTIKLTYELNDGHLTVPDLTNGISTGIGGNDGNQVSTAMYKNVNRRLVDNDTITVLGDAGDTYKMSLFFTQEATAFQSVRLIGTEPQFNMGSSSHGPQYHMQDKASGLKMLVAHGASFEDQISMIRVDVLWGSNVVYDHCIAKAFGEKV